MIRRTNRYVSLWMAAVLMSAGCAEDAITPETEEFSEVTDNESIEQALQAITDDLGLAEDGDIGRLNDADERPAFGSDAFEREFGRDLGEREVDGDIADDPEISDRVDRGEVHVFNILAVWGRIKPNDADWSPLRWDPALQVMEGDGVRVRRELRFERGDRVHPQRVRHEVFMSSVTGPHVDGVVAQVAITAEDAANAFLRFRSLPLSVEIPARRLADLNEFHQIDRTGNGLMLVAVQRPPQPDPCAHGFMGGRWARTSDQGGVYGGVWRAAHGERSGYLAGRWGVTADGAQVFHGKVVNAQGEFLAFMAGNYNDGAYRGEIYGRGGNLLGHVRGHYAAADAGGHGLFRGVWQQVCERDEPNDPSCSVAADGRLEACEPTDRPLDRPNADDRPDDTDPTTDTPNDRPDNTDTPSDRPTDEDPNAGGDQPATGDERPTDDGNTTDGDRPSTGDRG